MKVVPLFTKSEQLKKAYKGIELSKPIFIILLAVVLIAFLTGLSFLIIFATIPCTFKTCHANATCINRPFGTKCKCNSGFQGNGIECDECGLSFPNSSFLNPYLIDSTPYKETVSYVIPFSYPATVDFYFFWEGLVYLPNSTKNYVFSHSSECTGVMINRRTVLTAASCIVTSFTYSPSGYGNDTLVFENKYTPAYSEWNSHYEVYFKISQDVYSNYAQDIWPTEQHLIENIIMHEGYDKSSLNNDLALIKLKKSVDLDNYGQLACLPDETDMLLQSSYLQDNNSVIALGWEYFFGAGYAWSQFPQNVLNADHPDCHDLYTETTDIDQLICTRDYTVNLTHQASSIAWLCNGFSGGPLYAKKQGSNSNKLVVIGVTLNDTECGISVYQNLFYFMDWINEHADY